LTLQGTKKQVITAGNLELDLIEDENNITLTNALPMYDEMGMIQEPFTFRLKNKGTTDINYTLKLVDITTGDKLETSDVKYYLTKDGTGSPALLSNLTDGQVDSGTIAGNQTIEYTLRLWIDASVTENSRISGKSLSYRIDVEVSQKIVEDSQEFADASGANIPELTSGMIPVTYDETSKIWKKADTAEEWYNYNNQNWANAVTVTESTRANYMSAAAGESIDINDINTMWVWIPRYEYQYTDLGDQYAGGTFFLPGEIKINFISLTQTTPSDSTVYKIPEGFKFGDEELSGFWMAKFETSTLETCTAKSGSVETDCDLTTLTPQVKPNVTSWRGARVSTYFQVSRLMQDTTNANKYGFDTIGTGTMDVHMLKNTEWGIVAMLSQSKYGKYGNPNYEGTNKAVYQNKSSSYITGSSHGKPSQETVYTQATYDTPDTGYGASTTGTIYGVYDMSGGATEYVMGNYNNTSSSSGFLTYPDAKYYDNYTSTTASEGYKAGDTTYETSGWYMDRASFVDASNPWFTRGSTYYIEDAGVFCMDRMSGDSYSTSSFRLAIRP